MSTVTIPVDMAKYNRTRLEVAIDTNTITELLREAGYENVSLEFLRNIDSDMLKSVLAPLAQFPEGLTVVQVDSRVEFLNCAIVFVLEARR